MVASEGKHEHCTMAEFWDGYWEFRMAGRNSTELGHSDRTQLFSIGGLPDYGVFAARQKQPESRGLTVKLTGAFPCRRNTPRAQRPVEFSG